MSSDERPSWARRLRSEREARGWSVREAVRAMAMNSDRPLVEEDSLIRNWRRWESGDVMPDEFHQPLVAKVFDTVTHAFFPAPSRRDGNAEIVVVSGMETLDIVNRLQRSDVNNATLEALPLPVSLA